MFSRPKIFVYIAIGIVAFIFFGFFFPILILPAPLEDALPFLAPQPSPKPIRAVSVLGSEVIDRSLVYIPVDPPLTTLPIFRCFKERRGEEGKCQASLSTDYLSAYLLEIYDDSLVAGRQKEAKRHVEEITEALLAACYRNHEVCRHSFVPFYRRYQETHDSRLLTALTRVGTELLTSYTKSAYAFSQDIYKLLLLYDLTGDQAYLQEALTRFDESANVAAQDIDNPVVYHDATLDADIRRFDCGIYGAISLSLYQATKEPTYLETSRKFFSSMPRYSNRFGHLGALNLCLDGLSMLASVSDERFLSQLKDTLTYGLHAYWDTAATPKFNTDSGLILRDYTIDLTNQAFNFKIPSEHAWFLSHVVQFPEANFHLSGSNL